MAQENETVNSDLNFLDYERKKNKKKNLATKEVRVYATYTRCISIMTGLFSQVCKSLKS